MGKGKQTPAGIGEGSIGSMSSSVNELMQNVWPLTGSVADSYGNY